METYWDQFLHEYENEINFRSLHIILRSFWYYTNDMKEKCDEYMKFT